MQTYLLCLITRSYIEFSLSPFFPILSPGPLNNSDIDSTHSSNISAGHVYTGNGHVMMPGSVIPPDALYAINNEVTKIPPTRSPSIHTNPQFAYEAVFNDSKVGPSILSTIPTGFLPPSMNNIQLPLFQDILHKSSMPQPTCRSISREDPNSTCGQKSEFFDPPLCKL